MSKPHKKPHSWWRLCVLAMLASCSRERHPTNPPSVTPPLVSALKEDSGAESVQLGTHTQRTVPTSPTFTRDGLRRDVVLKDDHIGAITDMRLRSIGGVSTVWIAGTCGTRVLDNQGRVVHSHHLERECSEEVRFGNFQFVDMGGDGTPALVSMEELMRESIEVYSAVGKRLWTWRVPGDQKGEFGIKFVAPLTSEDGNCQLAVWVGSSEEVSLLSSDGRLLRTEKWERVNGDATVRLQHNDAGARIAYGSWNTIVVRDRFGNMMAKAKPSTDCRWISLVSQLSATSSGKVSLAVLATIGDDGRQAFEMSIGRDGSVETRVLGSEDDLKAVIRIRGGLQVRLDELERSGRAFASQHSSVGGPQRIELYHRDALLHQFLAYPGKGRHLFSPVLLAVPDPGGPNCESLWIGFGQTVTRLSLSVPQR